jgi:hypothetical protein
MTPIPSADLRRPVAADAGSRRPLVMRSAPVGLAVAGLAALPLVYTVNPNTTHVPLCPFHAITGLNCPLCGATRATYALLHGQFGTALADNAFYVLGLPLLILLWWRWHDLLRSAQRGRRVCHPLAWRGLLILATVFAIVRNLPFGSFLSPAAQ